MSGKDILSLIPSAIYVIGVFILSKELISGKISVNLGVTKSIFNIFPKSIHDTKEILKKGLKNSKDKFIVILDDLDRCKKKELLEILAFVKGIADLPNIVFILVGYEDYIKKQINDENNYLDKFIQCKIPVPSISNNDFRKFFIESLESSIFVKQSSNKNLDSIFQSSLLFKIGEDSIRKIFKTPRDVYRTLNSLNERYLSFFIDKKKLVEDIIILVMILYVADKNIFDYIRDNHKKINIANIKAHLKEQDINCFPLLEGLWPTIKVQKDIDSYFTFNDELFNEK